MKVQLTEANRGYYETLFAAMVEYCNELKDSLQLEQLPTEITDLPTYYHWLNKVRGIDNYDVFRLPVEEEEGYFDIDLNTRQITVPSKTFKVNGLGVQGDKAAEIIYFRCARFFDDMDLALCQHNADENATLQGACWIEWKRDKDIVPHVSLAYNFDVNVNDLIFGWVLGDEITSVAGDLEFSVRFVQWDSSEPVNGGSTPKLLTYSLGTQSTKCAIKPSLSSSYSLDGIQIESDLNRLVANRPIYSGIYQTAFGAHPVILAEHNLPIYANLQDYEEVGEGIYIYTIKAYSPDSGALSIAWYKDADLDGNENAVKITDEDLMTISGPDTNGNYTFTLKADSAGGYYAVISNKKADVPVRTTKSQGSTIEYASDFKIVENLLPTRAYSDGITTFHVSTEDANGIDVDTPVNAYNGVTYQWYIKESDKQTGGHAASGVVIDGATNADYTPFVGQDGLIYCEITNMRNKNTKTKKTLGECEVRALPMVSEGAIIEDGNGAYVVNFVEGADMRNLSYTWYDDKSHTIVSTTNHYAPWADDQYKSFYKSGETVNVTCTIYQKIWEDDQELKKEHSRMLNIAPIVP